MDKLILTERDAIQLTIDNGCDGKELELADFKRNGSLNGKRSKETGEFTNGSMKRFIRKLETIYESVTVEGKGKKRLYILEGKRVEQIPMEDDRKFGQYKNEDYIMSKFVFNKLLELQIEEDKNLYDWSVSVGAINLAKINVGMVRQHFLKCYFGEQSSEILDDFQTYVKNFNRNIIKKAFKWLEHCQLIKKTSHYAAIDLKGVKVNIDESTFDKFTVQRNEILSRYGLTVYNYQKYASNDEYQQVFEELELLYQRHKLKSVFITYSVKVKGNTVFDDVNLKTFQEKYLDRLIHNVLNLNKKKSTFPSLVISFRQYNILSLISFFYYNDKLQTVIDSLTPKKFACFLILNDREKRGVIMGKEYKKEKEGMSEMEDMLCGNSVKVNKEEEIKEEFDINNMTIDDYLDFLN